MPLLRRQDNSGQAIVGEPLSPDTNTTTKVTYGVENPTESPLTIRALAGPMSPKQVIFLLRVLHKWFLPE